MQRLEGFEGEAKKRFMLHYNFPPFSVGEVGFMRGAGRREIGHGALAERAVSAVLPSLGRLALCHARRLRHYGVERIVVVDGYHLRRIALTDGCGRSVESSVAGVAMGLVKEGDKYVILTDIAGAEDSLRRHGFQSRWNQRRHHRAANGY